MLHDLAAGLSFIPEEGKRNAASSSKNGAPPGRGSRLTDKQLPILTQGSRYAERLPIGLPKIIQKGAAQKARGVLPEVVSPDPGCRTLAGDIPSTKPKR